MKLQTRTMGEIEIKEEDIITFGTGIPGFEEYSKYIIVTPDTSIPFNYLQSVEDSNLSFIVTDPFVFYPSYDINIPDEVLEELRIEKPEHVAVYSIVTIKNSLNQATLNLLAPIALNITNKCAKQVILTDTKYRTKHSIFNSESGA
ncbi:hypothetical protein SY83_10990 [Paenibacillus swuensis]|uniref:Flagellar assembly factor FliW n=1 Tax=Paenibacillus swuensis TaxID=1178515 RepID=A0A172TI73_9BACL|nr:flagellar assembly protein FliW [Paenibacillus swuensis]ANE46710.1 hypothetical protein SY83_10990 [Paenibacillus swuensis]